MANLFSNSCNELSYWFSEMTLDNNGEVVSDINAGIVKLIPELMEKLNGENGSTYDRFIIPDCQVGMPDIAASTFYDTGSMWWYICLENQLANPFTEYLNNFLYYSFPQIILDDHDKKVNLSNTNSNSKIGKIIELK